MKSKAGREFIPGVDFGYESQPVMVGGVVTHPTATPELLVIVSGQAAPQRKSLCGDQKNKYYFQNQ